MAVVLKELVVERSPQERRTVTDLLTTPPRPRSKFTSFLLSLLGPPEVPIFPVGTGPVVFGGTASNEARERSFSDRLLATLQGADDSLDRLAKSLSQTSKQNRPLDELARNAKKIALIKALPLDLALREVELRQEERQLESQDRILPFIEELKGAKIELDRSLAGKRQAETAVLLDLAAAQREKVLAAAEFTRARARQESLNRDLIETALGGLDGFQKMIFLRDRLFPPVVEPRRVGRPGRIRRIAGFV